MKKAQHVFTRFKLVIVVVVVALANGSARAHHGRDFLLVETYELPHSGELYFLSNQDVIRQEGQTEFSVTPSLLYGATPRFSLELHGHIGKSGAESLRYESTGLGLHYQLTPGSRSSWKFGLSAEYEVAHHRNDEDDDHGEEEEHEEEHGAAITPFHEGHEHGEGDAESSGHHHGNNRFEARLVIARLKGKSNLTFNLIGARERHSGEGTEFGYTVGYRPDMTRRFGWGVEAQGECENGGSHEVLLGFYGEVSERLTLKAGLSTGFGSNSPDLTARTGVVWRF